MEPGPPLIIANDSAEAMIADWNDNIDIQIYCNGLGIEGQIGAAAVLYRNGITKWRLRLRLGPHSQHTIYEGKGTAIILGIELLQTERKVHTVSFGVDNQAAIMAIGLTCLVPSHYLWDILHECLQMFRNQHKNLDLNIRWTPGHMGLEGNKATDEEARAAA